MSYRGDEAYALLNANDEWVPTMYFEDERRGGPWAKLHWDPKQITILTDGTCASARALFVEMMTRVGVKTVAAGGLPQTGPMQVASGNRGASVYDVDQLDEDMLFARSIDKHIDANVNASIPEVRERGMFLNYASINLRDQIRHDSPIPLQFTYQAADCRLYYTIANAYNFTRLWHDVAAAAANPSLCVAGSTRFSATNTTIPYPSPILPAQRPSFRQENSTGEKVSLQVNPVEGLRDDDCKPPACEKFSQCRKADGETEDLSCDNGRGRCKTRQYNCSAQTSSELTCVPFTDNALCVKLGGVPDENAAWDQELKQTTTGTRPAQKRLCYPPPDLPRVCEPPNETPKLKCKHKKPKPPTGAQADPDP